MEPRARSTPRQFRRNPYRTLVLCAVLAVVAIVRYWRSDRPLEPPAPLTEGVYAVVRVVDGDTIIFAPHVVVRLIGVDTPETVKPEHPVEPFGLEASEFTRTFLSGGTARLSFDHERTDRFGRHLAYVWVGDRLLNEELARQGLARFEEHFKYSLAMKRRFRQAQQQAKREHLGIWSEEPVRPSGARGEPFDAARRRAASGRFAARPQGVQSRFPDLPATPHFKVSLG